MKCTIAKTSIASHRVKSHHLAFSVTISLQNAFVKMAISEMLLLVNVFFQINAQKVSYYHHSKETQVLSVESLRLTNSSYSACGINEEWRECSDIYCRKTCQNRGQILSCPKICKAGCSCKPGFIWDNNSKQCIPEHLCPAGMSLMTILKRIADITHFHKLS